MKRSTRSTLLALLLAAPVPVLAQDHGTAADAARAPMGTPGVDGMNSMMGGMAPMRTMTMECANKMEALRVSMEGGAMRNRMGPAPMAHGSMGQGRIRYDTVTAEALARAYLRGRTPESAQDTEIIDATFDAGRYAVSYRQGNTEGVVLVDATTGVVAPENPR